jgi:hypothetical protein
VRLRRLAFAPLLLVTVLGGLVAAPVGGAAIAATSGPGITSAVDADVVLTPIGKPTWIPVDLHVFSAPIGTAESGYAEFLDTAATILPPPNHVLDPTFGIGPGAPHPRPYDTEMGEGVAAAGFHQGQRFRVPEFSNGNGVWLSWMNVPCPRTPGTLGCSPDFKSGSSPDFKSGPIIPNKLFPIRVFGQDTHDGNFYSVLTDFTVPKLKGVQGHSHFPVFIADNRDFAPSGDTRPTGDYTYRLEMVDQSGAGWKIETTFVVGG